VGATDRSGLPRESEEIHQIAELLSSSGHNTLFIVNNRPVPMSLWWLTQDPAFKSLSEHPGFKALVNELRSRSIASDQAKL